jgi:hypothetical protein
MAKSKRVSPQKIFEQADCFFQAPAILCDVQPDNIELAVILGEPVIVIGAPTIELFLKCLICIETGHAPRGHDLKGLFDKLSDNTRSRIENAWNTGIACVAPVSGTIWRIDWELKWPVICRPLWRLQVGHSSVFDTATKVKYYLQDLPALLGRVILEMKPEWKSVRRTPQPLALPIRH